MNIKDKILHFLKNNNLINTRKPLLIGFSGGQDSLCLLDIMKDLAKENNFKIIAVHLNHNWRGEESKKEQRTAFDYCKEHNIEFYTETLEATEKKTEIEARNQRYKFFEKCALKSSSQALLTGHTKTDNTETILYRIIKGTGIHGLRGIPKKREGKNYTIYRPMLDITRNETEIYCKGKNIPISNDSSNFDDKYTRNNLRLNIIPKLKEINLNFDNAIDNLCSIASDYEEILSDTPNLENLNPKEFLEQKPALQKIIAHKFLIKNNINYDKKKITEIVDFIKDNFKKPCGKKLSLTTGLWLFVSQEKFEVIKKSTKSLPKKELVIEEFKEELPKIFPNEKAKKIIVNIPKDLTDIELRTRKEGDIIQPFGMNGTMKLKKFFINKAIAEHERNEIMLVANKNEILWAVGVGISEKLRVKDKATHTIELR